MDARNRTWHDRDHLRYGSDLSDEEWRVLALFLPPPAHTGRRRLWPMREMLHAIFYVPGSRLVRITSYGIESMKISIVTPTYNYRRFLEANLRSVEAQQGDFQVEHIIFDCMSTEGTESIVNQRRQTNGLP